jgi:hypothetical protein
MSIGGNASLNDWFKKFNLPESSSLDFKYKTKAAKFYRDRLKAMAEEAPFNETEPVGDDALTICEEFVPREPYIPQAPPVPPQQEEPQPQESTFGRIGGMFGSFMSTAASVGSAVASKAAEIKETPTFQAVSATTSSVVSSTVDVVKSGTASAYEYSKSAASEVGHFAETQYKKINESETVQSVKSTAVDNYNRLEKAAKDQYHNMTGSSGRNTPPEYQ